MKFNVHAGHNPAGRIACGAVGILDESRENRKVRDYLISFLRAQGHTVYDCTCDNGTSQNDVLKKIVAKCNAHSGIACDISLHLNAGGGHGAECEIYGTGGNAEKYAKKIQAAIVKRTGYTDRGVKVRKDLYVLRKTTAPAVLVECCFVDSAADAKVWNPKTMAAAICEGLTGANPLANTSDAVEKNTKEETKDMTEAEVRKIIAAVEEEKAKHAASAWAENAWSAATQAGVLDGTAPQANVTREMLAQVFLNAGLIGGGDMPSEWAEQAFTAATDAGMLDGTNPHGVVTREQLAVVLQKIGLVGTGQKAETEEPQTD